MEMTVTKTVRFDAAHYLNNPDLTPEENIAKFHKCSCYKKPYDTATTGYSIEPHGHTYTLEVTVAGKVDLETGFVIDFKELKNILNDHVIEVLDHRFINNHPYFRDKNATAENISKFIWDQIVWKINTAMRRLYRIKLWETPDSYATYEGHLDPDEEAGGTI